MGVICEPEVITRKLSALETKMIQRALLSYTMPFFISFNIACAIPDCSDVTTEDVAQIVAQKSSILENIDPQTFLDQLTAAISQQDPAPDTFTFGFTYDPVASTISDAVTAIVPAGYEFLGVGGCLSEYSDGLYDYSSYIYTRSNPRYSITECATWCDNIAASACWVQNQAEKPYLGLSYEDIGECYCHFSTSDSTNNVDPSDICTLPDDATSISGRGFGQIVLSDCTADALGYNTPDGCLSDFSCFKYIG